MSVPPARPALAEETPLISIGLSVLNAGPYIDEAICSILAQTYPHWELLIADDGSTDDTLARIRRYDDPRIRVFADGRRRLGLPVRLNQLMDAARGTLFARMDGDDIAYPDRLTRQLAYLRAHPEVDVVATGLLVFRSDGSIDGQVRQRGETHEAITATPWSGFHFNHATWLGHIDWFRRFRYREDAVRTEDDDLIMRSYRHSRFARMPDILYGYRIDELSLKKILVARYHFARTLVREAQRQGDRRLLRGVPVQLLKGAVDLVAIGTGLNYRLLRHRATPIAEAVAERWREVQAVVEACRAAAA